MKARYWSERWRGNTTDRLVDLVLRVQSEPLPPLVSLAREYRVSTRTIARYITAIERRVPVRRLHEHD